MIWRVCDRATFDALRRTRNRGRSGPVWARHVPGSEHEPTRVAFTVSTKVGGAVVRNRLRRRLRAICRELDDSQQLPVGAWLFGVDPRGANAPYETLAGAVSASVSAATASR